VIWIRNKNAKEKAPEGADEDPDAAEEFEEEEVEFLTLDDIPGEFAT